MAKRTINLDMTACDNREMRIGSITSWDGSASELVAASNYEERGKGEKKKGCSGGRAEGNSTGQLRRRHRESKGRERKE